mmetsp:Transcript_19252/g.26062  ORF Transcript_19252/g.26062 Transcript_19252/m.26062 type:complete len:90 (-) Transcript_19252:1549-1818(-)|eukprot:CAMPEP_0170476840 /NCGR_PEP_ID=MMETSP0123-20130129/18181_1 /TAXON_ID=182087 /ORGANISM="Favella ehrenbergii, Strain Fehren 1" /LENGTH=89 /DNA_ID=CAMNT_0010748133 /DNA_START=281 /DNA_END=550 /DNA_ORIENTATION=+
MIQASKPQVCGQEMIVENEGEGSEQPEPLPSNMYTIPASESNYQYDGTGSSKMLEQMTVGLDNLNMKPMKNDPEKYQGDPLKDLHDDAD